MSRYRSIVFVGALFSVGTACGMDPGETTATESASLLPAASGSCYCDVYVSVYDDTCGAACGLIGTSESHGVWWSSPSEAQCIQWCQQRAWNKGGSTCDQYVPASRSAVLDWQGRWGFRPYFFYHQQYACSDL